MQRYAVARACTTRQRRRRGEGSKILPLTALWIRRCRLGTANSLPGSCLPAIPKRHEVLGHLDVLASGVGKRCPEGLAPSSKIEVLGIVMVADMEVEDAVERRDHPAAAPDARDNILQREPFIFAGVNPGSGESMSLLPGPMRGWTSSW